MKKIIDKVFILVCCLMLFSGAVNSVFAVLPLLAVITISSLSQYSRYNIFTIIIESIYILLCFINPLFIFFLPVIIYDILCRKRYYLCGVSVIAFIFSINSLDDWQIILVLSLSLLAALLQIRTANLQKAEETLIEIRDNSAELNMILTEKNKHLRENQDYEIYLATLRERNRIAREIHDNVGHLLSRSILQVGALEAVTKDELQNESLCTLSDTLNNAMNTIRQSVHDLHDDSIDLKQSLLYAVKPLSDKGLKVRTDFDFSKDIPNHIKFSFISILKEGVSNIIKHSNGDSVVVSLFEHPAFYQFTIEDNGSCPDYIKDGGMGLSNMRDRIESINGLIQIKSSKKGFRIFITLRKEEGR